MPSRASSTPPIASGPSAPPTAATIGSPSRNPRPKCALMNRAFPIARPRMNATGGIAANALAATATMRSPGVDRATATDLAPPRRRRSVSRSRPLGRRDPAEDAEQERSSNGPHQCVLHRAAEDAGRHDRHQGHDRVDLAARRCDAGPDDDQVARHWNRQAGLLDEDQPDDEEQPGRRELHVSPTGQAPAAASDSSRIVSARSTSSAVVTSGGMMRDDVARTARRTAASACRASASARTRL